MGKSEVIALHHFVLFCLGQLRVQFANEEQLDPLCKWFALPMTLQ
jgi:hypothetical protein